MSPQILNFYRSRFQPSEKLSTPHTCLTVSVLCADTEEEAHRLALSRQLLFLRFVTQQGNAQVPPVEEAEQYPYSTQELAFLRNKFQRTAIGTPEQVKEQLLQLANEFNADELMTVTITYDFAARLRSYELLAQTFNEERELNNSPLSNS